MNLFSDIINSKPIGGVEEYDEGVFRTINTPFNLPNSVNDFNLEYDFYFSKNVNRIFDKLYQNVEYLRGFSKIYNNKFPLSEVQCGEYGEGILGIEVSDQREVVFDNTSIRIYIKGVLQQTIEKTQFGNFFNIKDVTIDGNFLYILDDLFVVKLDIETTTYNFLTFFGGLGSKSSEYKFRDPTQIIFDNGQLFIFDKGNQVVKSYDRDLTFLGNLTWSNHIRTIAVLDGAVAYVGDGLFQYGSTRIEHGLVDEEEVLMDNFQKGFFWIRNGSSIKKIALNGLELYSKSRSQISNIIRYGSSLVVVQNGMVNREIEYHFSKSVLSEDSLIYTLDQILINDDELNTDIVVNDSINKIYELIDDLNRKIVNKFITIFNSESQETYVGTVPMYDTEFFLESNFDGFIGVNSNYHISNDILYSLQDTSVIENDSFVLFEYISRGEDEYLVEYVDQEFDREFEVIGAPKNNQLYHRHDEIVSCHAWERTLDAFDKLFTFTMNRLNGIEVFDISSASLDDIDELDTRFANSINWSLGSQKCEGIAPQLFNPNFTPVSYGDIKLPELKCGNLRSPECSD